MRNIMKNARSHWSLLAIMSLCLALALIPWQAFGQDSQTPPEETTTEASVSSEENSGETPAPLEEDSDKADDLNNVNDTEDESVPEEGTDGESTDTSTETPASSDDTIPEAEDAPPPGLETDDLATQEEITPLAVYSGSCGTSLNWTFDDETGVLSITGSGAMTNYVYGPYSPWFSYHASITSVEPPNGLTTIGNFAFRECSSLTSITIPDSVTHIGFNTFSYCTSLTSITIPDSVTSLDRGTFSNCSGLTSIIIPDSITTIPGNSFENCTSLTSITIPDTVTNIGFNAFYCCLLSDVVFERATAPVLDAGAFNSG